MTTGSPDEVSTKAAMDEIREDLRRSSERTAAFEADHLQRRTEMDARHARNMEELAAIRALQTETARQMKETDRRMAETDRRMAETDRRLKKAEDLFTTQWGRLMESLVEGDLAPLLKARGVDVSYTHRRFEGSRNGDHCEFDILAANGEEVVVVEVKTTLRPEDVTRFLAKLGRFKEWVRAYRDYRVFGAVAFLQTGPSVIRQAERRGLFVIRATGNSASILNPPDFVPRVFP